MCGAALQLDGVDALLLEAAANLVDDGDAGRAADARGTGAHHVEERVRVTDAAGGLDAEAVSHGGAVAFMSLTSSTVAPPVEQPVDVLTNVGFTRVAISQILTFSSSVSRQVSRMTLQGMGSPVASRASWQAATIWVISSST